MLVGMRPTSHTHAVVVLRTAVAGVVRAVALLLVALVGVAVPAAAHTGGDADVVLTLDGPAALLEGVQVQVVNRLAPQLVVSNPTPRVIEVVGLEQRPFLRIGPDGVEANLAVAEWYTTNDPFGAAELPEGVGGEDAWALVSEQPSWGWFDHRLHPRPLQAPQEIAAIGQPADFDTWTVDLTVDGEPTVLSGAFRYQPLRGGFIPSVTSVLPDGVDLAILPGLVPGLFLDYSGTGAVLVLGAAGEPFLRLDPQGVEANLRSPSWIDSARASEGTTPTDVADPDATPTWARVAEVPRFGWIDPRLGYADREPPPAVIAAAEPVDVADWTIPFEVAGQSVEVAGVIRWQPSPDLQPRTTAGSAGASLRWAAVAGVVVLSGGGLLLTRRRAPRSRPAADRGRR